MKVFYQSTEALWLLFNLFASALALKEEKAFAWMYMSTHTQGETISFAVTKCSRMGAYIHHCQSVFQLVSLPCVPLLLFPSFVFPLLVHRSLHAIYFLLFLQW